VVTLEAHANWLLQSKILHRLRQRGNVTKETADRPPGRVDPIDGYLPHPDRAVDAPSNGQDALAVPNATTSL
jgi:hypothetical protein